MSKAKKEAEKMLKAIEFEAAPMSTDRGRRIPTCSPLTRKDRRHSGHKIICYDDKDFPIQFDTYDSWSDYRDGLRDRSSMRKNIYIQMSWYNDELYNELIRINRKYRKHEKIRKVMKNKKKIKNLKKFINFNILEIQEKRE
jgi:hypothetical protein